MAERVADELGDPSIGKLVGYQIRMEARRSAETRLLFCTTGVILRRLIEDPALKGISHVVVDEVHERQVRAWRCCLPDVKALKKSVQLIIFSRVDSLAVAN